MYYNSAGPGQSHYNYVAVQGAGEPSDPAYRCASKAYDYFNARYMYGDHAVGGLGTYAELAGANTQAGTVNYVDESAYGKRDMCDKSRFFGGLRHPVLYAKNQLRSHNLLLWVAIAVALAYGFKTGRLNLAQRNTQLLLAAVAVAILFFFR
jgi:hypothetical protein